MTLDQLVDHPLERFRQTADGGRRAAATRPNRNLLAETAGA